MFVYLRNGLAFKTLVKEEEREINRLKKLLAFVVLEFKILDLIALTIIFASGGMENIPLSGTCLLVDATILFLLGTTHGRCSGLALDLCSDVTSVCTGNHMMSWGPNWG